MGEGFIPDVWAKALMDDMQNAGKLWDDFILGPEEHRRRGHSETMTDAEWEATKAARAERFAEWRKMTDKLIEDGTLDYAHCYECGGELELNDHRPSEWVWDETEAEHRARVPKTHMPPTITFATKKVVFPRDDD
jgi:hypothetical protein